jgi:predicted nucleotidyltransferase
MSDSPAQDAAAAAAATDFARALVVSWQRELGLDLLGCYLLGSLAHGGFSRRYSDIDVAVVAQDGLSPPVHEQLLATAQAIDPALAGKLSLFWSNRLFAVGRFPPLDLVDYLDHGVKLIERVRVLPPRPSLAEIRAYLAAAPFANWAERANRFAAEDALDPADRKPYLRALLYPARLLFSWSTGRIGANDDAVAFVQAAAPPGLDGDLIARALQCRHAAADPDPLFSVRSALPRQVAACATVMAG